MASNNEPNVMMVIGGRGNDPENLKSVECFDFENNQWSPLGEMPEGRAFCSGAVVGAKVYVVGGKEDGVDGVTNKVFMYDPSVDTWTLINSRMLSERWGHGVAVLNDKIYVVGGNNMDDESQYYTEVLDLTDGPHPKPNQGPSPKWDYVAKLKVSRHAAGVAALNGKIFAVGGNECPSGVNRPTDVTSVEIYDPEQNVWTSPGIYMSESKNGVGLGVLDGVLYCVGGSGMGNTVERFNEDTNTWSQVAEMNHRRLYPGVLTHAGRLYVVGGFDRSYTPLSSVEMYDPSTNTWTLVADMSVGRAGPAVALIQRPKAE